MLRSLAGYCYCDWLDICGAITEEAFSGGGAGVAGGKGGGGGGRMMFGESCECAVNVVCGGVTSAMR